MGLRKLVGRVRRLIGSAYFYDRTPSLVIGLEDWVKNLGHF